MTSFSRGRGIHRANYKSELKPGVKTTAPSPLCQRLHDEIFEMKVDKMKESLTMLSQEDPKKVEEFINYLLSCIYLDDKLVISFMRIYTQFAADFESLVAKKTNELRSIILNDLHSKYESELELREQDSNFLRNFTCVLVTQFMASYIGYPFLVPPIIHTFNLLLDSYDTDSLDILAVLYIKSWKRVKETESDKFESFQTSLRKALIESKDWRKSYVILFLIDMSNGATESLSQPLCEFYRQKLNQVTIYKLCNWIQDDNVKKVFQDDKKNVAVVKSLANVKISDKVENAPEDVPKQTVPRAIRGTGAMDK